MASRLLLLALAVAAVSAQVPLPPSLLGGVDLTVSAATNRLLDAHGRERVFHGTSGLSLSLSQSRLVYLCISISNTIVMGLYTHVFLLIHQFSDHVPIINPALGSPHRHQHCRESAAVPPRHVGRVRRGALAERRGRPRAAAVDGPHDDPPIGCAD